MKNTNANVDLTEEKGKLKQKFAHLTHDDLLLEEGKKEEISGKHRARLNQTEQELEKILASLQDLDRLWDSK